MAIETRSHRYFEPVLDPHTDFGAPSRTMFVSHIGDDTIIRSSSPERYLIPDIDLLPSGLYGGTVGSAPTTIGLDRGLLTVCLFANDEAAEVFSSVLDGGVRSITLKAASGDRWTYGISPDHTIALKPFDTTPAYKQRSGAQRPTRLDAVVADAVLPLPTIEDLTGYVTPDRVSVPRTNQTVADVATCISELSGLTDRQLAGIFHVARETYQRWRTGELTNPTRGNRRRLGLLLRLLQDLHARGVEVRDWLNDVSAIDGMTPLDLLELGRIDDVECLTAQMPSDRAVSTRLEPDGSSVTYGSELPGFARRSDEETHDLIVDDDEDWSDVQAEAVSDDE